MKHDKDFPIRRSRAPRRLAFGLLLLLQVALLGLPGSPGRADDRDLLRRGSAKPYVFILFDTSGSMHWSPKCIGRAARRRGLRLPLPDRRLLRTAQRGRSEFEVLPGEGGPLRRHRGDRQRRLRLRHLQPGPAPGDLEALAVLGPGRRGEPQRHALPRRRLRRGVRRPVAVRHGQRRRQHRLLSPGPGRPDRHLGARPGPPAAQGRQPHERRAPGLRSERRRRVRGHLHAALRQPGGLLAHLPHRRRPLQPLRVPRRRRLGVRRLRPHRPVHLLGPGAPSGPTPSSATSPRAPPPTAPRATRARAGTATTTAATTTSTTSTCASTPRRARSLRCSTRATWCPSTGPPTTANRILGRLAPNRLLGESIPDFSVARYLEDQPGGNGLLEPATRGVKPLIAFGSTPLGNSIRDFRTWYAGCAQGACPTPPAGATWPRPTTRTGAAARSTCW